MRKSLLIVTITVIIILAGVGYWKLTGRTVGIQNYDDFAKCLTEKGVIMYGSEYCSHCSNQKEMFGDSFQYINYVECSENPELCTEMGILAIPTWYINGNLYTGEKTIQELSNLSGCSVG